MPITTFTPDITTYRERPFAGVEDWQGQDYAGIPSATNRAQRLDYYIRLSWSQLEGSTQGNYTFSKLDTEFRRAMDRRQKISFGVMTVCPGGCDSFNGPTSYDGASSIYPLYLHNLMQSESVKDWRLNGAWIPNWNSNHYLSRMEALLTAMANYINTTTYKPAWSSVAIPYSHALNYIDIRFMGSWGEWHHASIVDPVSNYPSGMRPTIATYKRIIDAHVNAFPNNPLVMLMATLDAMWFNNTQTPNEITWYALTKSNNWGPIGIRRDQIGSAAWSSSDNYVHHYMENNNRSFGTSGPFKNTIMERWKTSPILGEPEGPFSDIPNMEAEGAFYRFVSSGNGNFSSPAGDSRMRAFANAVGYKLLVENVNFTNTSNSITITANWRNAGVTPTYEDWDIVFELVNGNTVVWSGISGFKPKRFLPSTTATAYTETLPVSVPTGTYTLRFSVRDPKGYRQPMPLFMTGQATNGTFNIGSITIGGTTTTTSTTTTVPTTTTTTTSSSSTTSTTTVTTTSTTTSLPTTTTTTTTSVPTTTTTTTTNIVPNKPPVANAGEDQFLVLPVDFAVLDGSKSSDPEGKPLKYYWRKMAGPNCTLAATTSPKCTVTNLQKGVYMFELRVVDDKSVVSVDTTAIVAMETPIGTQKTIKSVTQNILYTNGTSQTQIIS